MLGGGYSFMWICVDCCGAVCSGKHGKSSQCLSYLSSSSLPADYPYIPRFHIIRLNPHPVALLLRVASPPTDQCCLTAPVNQCLFSPLSPSLLLPTLFHVSAWELWHSVIQQVTNVLTFNHYAIKTNANRPKINVKQLTWKIFFRL